MMMVVNDTSELAPQVTLFPDGGILLLLTSSSQ